MTEIQIIQQVIDGAVKSGMFPNVANVMTVSNAWELIKNQLVNHAERLTECAEWKKENLSLHQDRRALQEEIAILKDKMDA